MPVFKSHVCESQLCGQVTVITLSIISVKKESTFDMGDMS